MTRSGKPLLVVSPRGTLSRWALEHSRLRKLAMWHLFQRAAIAKAGLFHATSEAECHDIRRSGFRQPVAVIPNGIDMPPILPKGPSAGTRTLLFLGRIHKVKGIDMLLQAWAGLQDAFPDGNLRIVGPGAEDYVDS